MVHSQSTALILTKYRESNKVSLLFVNDKDALFSSIFLPLLPEVVLEMLIMMVNKANSWLFLISIDTVVP